MLALVTIGVFGLFHPTEFDVQPCRGSVLIVESGGQRRVLEGGDSAHITASATVTGRGNAPVAFILGIPRKIHREYHGRLTIRADAGHLTAIVEMDREIAVASIVAAESPPGAPLEALKAQAVVARSFLAASHRRHDGFDFCDTTHCQFLRAPPPDGALASRAQQETTGLVIAYRGRIVPALYSANCGGHTRSLEEAGWALQDYPYFGVDCPASGPVSGHQIGMCQVGAAELAQRGQSFQQILGKYFPATTLRTIPK